jgi:hypothetical protein
VLTLKVSSSEDSSSFWSQDFSIPGMASGVLLVPVSSSLLLPSINFLINEH